VHLDCGIGGAVARHLLNIALHIANKMGKCYVMKQQQKKSDFGTPEE
jgi:hypothetical protein